MIFPHNKRDEIGKLTSDLCNFLFCKDHSDQCSVGSNLVNQSSHRSQMMISAHVTHSFFQIISVPPG